MKTLTDLIDYFFNTVMQSTFMMIMFGSMFLALILILTKLPYRIIFKKIIGAFIRFEPQVPEDEFAYLNKNKRLFNDSTKL
jgi:hypothetical protein